MLKKWLIKYDLMPILWPFGPGGEYGGWWMAIPAAVSLFSSLMGNKEKKAAAEEERQLLNEYIQGSDSAKEYILREIGGGDIRAGVDRLLNMESRQNMSGMELTQFNEKMMPKWAKADKAVVDRMRGITQGRLEESATRGVGESIARDIRAANQVRNALAAKARGMAGTPVAGGQAALMNQVDLAAIPELTNIAGSGEERMRARQNEDLALAQAFANMTKGQHKTGWNKTTFDKSVTGFNPAQNVQTALALKSPTQPFAGSTGMTPGWDALGGAADFAAMLMMQNKKQ